jgi:hypothetical protein
VTRPYQGISLPKSKYPGYEVDSTGRFYHPDGERKITDNSQCIMILEWRGETSNFLCGRDVDVLWNDPIPHFIFNKTHY